MNEEIKQSHIKVAQIHTERLSLALSRIQHIFPFTAQKVENLSDTELADTDFFVHRFSKLQDLIGSKILQILLEKKLVDTSGKTPIDILNLSEKYYFIPSKAEWNIMREIRNHLTHEYPDEPETTAAHFNQAVEAAHKLIAIWHALKKHLEEKE